jgi:hypothetical protein
MGGGRAKRTVSQIRSGMGPKLKKNLFLFYTQTINGSGSLKPVANKIPQLLHAQLPTLSGYP